MPEFCKSCKRRKKNCVNYEDCSRWLDWFEAKWSEVCRKVKRELRRVKR